MRMLPAPDGVAPALIQRALQAPACGGRRGRADAHLRVEHRIAAGTVVAPQPQLCAACHRRLRLHVAIGAAPRCPRLPHAIEHGSIDLPLQHRGRRRNQQPPSIASHRVAILVTRFIADQRIAPGFGDAPARLFHFKTAIQAGESTIHRRVVQAIQLSIVAAQPALLEHAAGHIEAAA
ncbi:hypothetical protein G6F68_014727 [Rhizopus microsporus]|nr:hypothetical protein G6F68_014727 [Rhizopus microsporus]